MSAGTARNIKGDEKKRLRGGWLCLPVGKLCLLEPGTREVHLGKVWSHSPKQARGREFQLVGGIVSTKPQVQNNARVSGAVSVQALVWGGGSTTGQGQGVGVG